MKTRLVFAALVLALAMGGIAPLSVTTAFAQSPDAGAPAPKGCPGGGECTSGTPTSPDCNAGGNCTAGSDTGSLCIMDDSCANEVELTGQCTGDTCTSGTQYDAYCTSEGCTKKVPAATKAAAPDIGDVTRWDVRYEDDVLGDVHGEAFVNWQGVAKGNTQPQGTARVILDNPNGGQHGFLSTNQFAVSGKYNDTILATLTGASPAAPVTAPPDFSKFPRLAAGAGDSIDIEVNHASQKFAVKARALVPAGEVSLALMVQSNGVLDGTWRYYANPLTERDHNGTGRLGGYRLLDKDEMDALNNPPTDGQREIDGSFLGVQAGMEQWWPKPTVIAHIAVVEDQLRFASGLPVYGTPGLSRYLASGPHQAVKTADGEGGSDYTAYSSAAVGSALDLQSHRMLFVVGRNLPIYKGKPLASIYAATIRSKDGTAHNPAFANPHIVATSQDDAISPENAALVARGWQQIVDQLNDAGAHNKQNGPITKDDVSHGMEFALIRVDLTADFSAGPQVLIWGGSAMPWLLQFGDNMIEAHFVRSVATNADGTTATTEPADEFFTPEKVAVELTTTWRNPVNSIPVQLGDGVAKAAPMIAHRVGPASGSNSRTVYRTDFFLVGAGGTGRAGGGLVAWVDQPALIDQKNFQFITAPLIRAKLSLTPASRTPGGPPWLWKEAVLAAAASRGIAAADIPTGAFRPAGADGQTNAGALKPIATVDTIPVTLADLAAMLMLRDNFIDMMRSQAAWLGSVKSDADLVKFLAWVKPYVFFNPSSFPPDIYAVPQPPGGHVIYSWWLSATIGDRNLDVAMNAIDDVNNWIAVAGLTFKQLPGIVFNDGPAPPAASSSPFAKLQVTAFDGSTTTLYAALQFADNPPPGTDLSKLRQWKIDVAREALGKYLPVVNASIENAKAIKDTDIKGLLKLTGVGFGATIKRIVPRLMTLQDQNAGSALWVPDRFGRAAVVNLYTTAAAARAHEDYTDIKSQYAIMVASTILMIPAIVSETALAAVVSLAGNLVVWEASSALQVIETHEGQKDLELEFGNAAALGTERLGEAMQKKSEWFQTFLSIGVQGALVAFQATFDALPKISKEMAAIRGAELLPKLEQSGAKAFKELTAEEQRAVAALLENTAIRRGSGQVISLEQSRAAVEAEKIVSEVHPPVEGEGMPALEQPAAADAAEVAAVENASVNDAVVSDLPKVTDPKQNARIFIRSPAGNVEFKLGKKLGEGASSRVYEVLEIGGKPVSEPTVIKFPNEFNEYGDKNPFGTPKEQIERMARANEYLKATRAGPNPIEFAEIIEIHPDAEEPYLLQKKVGGNGEVLVNAKELMEVIMGGMQGRPFAYAELSQKFPPAMQRAVVRLYYSIGVNRLVSTDLSLGNIYFKKVGEEWIAGILDVDHVVSIDKIGDDATWKWVKKVAANPEHKSISSVAVDGRAMNRSPLTFMEKMFEIDLWRQ